LLQNLRPGVGFLPRPLPSWRRSGDLARRSGDLARRSGERLFFGEAERTDTAESDSDTAETDAEFLASQRISVKRFKTPTEKKKLFVYIVHSNI
jgi:hypothetical protein